MSMTVGELVARGKVDDSEFNRGLDRMERRFGGAAGRLAGMLSRFGRDTGRKMGEAGDEAGKSFGSRFAQSTLGRLKAARQLFTRSGSDAGKAHGEALTRDSNGRLRDSRGRFAKTGAEIALGFIGTTIKVLQGHAGAITNVIKNPYALAGIAIVGIGTAVAGLAAVSGLLLAGIGGGFLAIGIKSVMASQQVKGAVGELQVTFKTAMSSATASVQGPLIGVLGRLRKTVTDLTPKVRKMFEDISPSIDNLGAGVDRFIRKFVGGGGLAAAVEASGDVLDDLAAKLPDTGEAFNDFFDDIAEGSEGASSGLTSLLSLVNGAIRMLGEVLKGASFAWQGLTDAAETSWGPLSRVTKAITEVSKEERDATDSGDELQDSMGSLSDGAKDLEGNLRKLQDAVAGLTLSSAAAATSASEAHRRLGEALKENGKSFQLGTKAGDENRSMLERAAREAHGLRNAVRDLAISQGDTAGATAKGDKAMAEYIGTLRNTLKQADLTDAQIDELLKTFGLIPPAKNTKVSAPGAPQSKAAIDAHNASASRVPAAKSTRLGLNLQYASAEAAARWRGSGPSSSRSSTLHLNLQYGSADAADKWNRARGGLISKYAQGGRVRGFANGGFSGYVRGPGTTTSDSILARLSDKEFVVKASSVARLGVPLLNHINNTGRLPMGFAGGGPLAAAHEILNRIKSGGSIFEDLSFHGMSGNASKWVDTVARSLGSQPFDPKDPGLEASLIRGVQRFIDQNSGAAMGGSAQSAVITELRALRADVRALQLRVSIGDETIARSARRGERALTYRGT